MLIDRKLSEEIQSKTLNKYGVQLGNNFYLEPDDVLHIIEDLLIEINNLEKKYEDLERVMQDNYKHISIEEQI